MHNFSGFTPEHDYKPTGEPFEIDERTTALPTLFRGEPFVVLAVGPDPEDGGDDSTVVRYVHLNADQLERMYEGP
jgi:hypothetical protein